MDASQVMTRRVITVGSKVTLDMAVDLLLQNGISGLPVVNAEDNLVGMLSEGDLLRRTEMGTERKRPRWLELLHGSKKLADEYVRAHGRYVEDVMTTKVISVAPGTSLVDIVELMERWHIKRVPVVENGKLVGIVSRTNLLQSMILADSPTGEEMRNDEDIRAQLWAELETSPWAPCCLINVVVHKGIVDLHGTISTGPQRAALCTAAANTPGVKQVRDYLVWRDFLTGLVIEVPDEDHRLTNAAS